MSVSKEQVLATAALARLDLAQSTKGVLSPQEAEIHVNRLAAQMESIVGYMDILEQVDTTGVEPLYFPLCEAAGPRADEAVKKRGVEEILSGAPARQGRFFAVPPVI